MLRRSKPPIQALFAPALSAFGVWSFMRFGAWGRFRQLVYRVLRKVVHDGQQHTATRGNVFRRDLVQRNGVDLLSQWHQRLAQALPQRGQENIDILAVVGPLLQRHIAQGLHGPQCGEGGGLHHARLHAQLAFGQAIFFPEDAQKGPVAQLHVVGRQPDLQCAQQCARGVFDEVGHAVVGHGLVPAPQHPLGDFSFILRGGFGQNLFLVKHRNCPCYNRANPPE